MPIEGSRISEFRDFCTGSKLAYHIETYGCQMNVRDSDELSGMLEALGCVRAASLEEAGLVIFNTCCVRDHAEARVRGNVGALRERKEENPELIIGVCGCMMQQEGAAEKFIRRYPFVDFLFGTHNMSDFPLILAEAVLSKKSVVAIEKKRARRHEAPMRRAPGLSAFVTIMHGCDNFCSYCIVPYVRGRESSRPMDEILSEIGALAKNGTAALTLLGQNVNSYQSEGYGKDAFAALLKKIGAIEGIKRVGFMTSHPKDVPDSLLDAIANGAHMNKHIHLPVQSGSDAILAAMNRGYTREGYLALIGRIREYIPGVELTTDVIVGFPGETERDFEDTLDLIERAGFASAYTFQYSPRKGTKAAEMPVHISGEIKKERLLRLNALQEKITEANSAAYVGRVESVLVESAENGKLSGKTTAQKNVSFTGAGAVGEIVTVKITAARRSALVGERVGEEA